MKLQPKSEKDSDRFTSNFSGIVFLFAELSSFVFLVHVERASERARDVFNFLFNQKNERVWLAALLAWLDDRDPHKSHCMSGELLFSVPGKLLNWALFSSVQKRKKEWDSVGPTIIAAEKTFSAGAIAASERVCLSVSFVVHKKKLFPTRLKNNERSEEEARAIVFPGEMFFPPLPSKAKWAWNEREERKSSFLFGDLLSLSLV